MVTKAEALTAHSFHWGNCTRAVGKRGGITEHVCEYRRNGKTQTWKRDANRWRVPVKRGLYEYGDITPERAHEWHTPEDCPLNHTNAALGVQHHMTRIQPVSIPMFTNQWFRAVCTCGFTAPEHPSEDAVRVDLAKHLAAVDPLPGVIGAA